MGDVVRIEHGAGGRESWRLIRKLILSRVPPGLTRVGEGFGLDVLDDGSAIKVGEGRYVVFTSDSFTVSPIEFPGGNIGLLAAHGTLNDLVMMGAEPVAFLDTIVAEEGLPMDVLDRMIGSMINVLVSEGVAVLGGDLKVMPKGSVDKVVITGFGIGFSNNPVVDNALRPGDKIIITSPIAEHGAAILAAQLGLTDEAPGLRSDTRPLTKTVLPVIKKYSDSVHGARDPTRGGVAATLNEWAETNGVTIVIRRADIPIREEVRAFLDAMGVDPLSTASEGVAVLAVAPESAEDVVRELRALGEDRATIVGEVTHPPSDLLKGRVIAETEVGGRVLVEPKSINLPRIC